MAGRKKYDREEVKRLHEEGLTDGVMAERIGCDIRHLQAMRRELGLEANSEEFDTGKMIALFRAGWSVHKIADEMGVEDEEIKERLNAERQYQGIVH